MQQSLLIQWKMLLTSLATVIATASPVQIFSQQPNNPPAQNIPGSSGASQNWAGYAATNGTFTSVTGTWIVPTVTTTDHTSSDAAWVGIGGVQNEDLIQAGIQNTIDSNGQVTVSAFYEMLPNASQTIPVTVNPGDSVTVMITQQSPGQWQITFKDNTNNNNYNTSVSYTSSESSAEWIEEAPSDGRSILPLDNFGSISFSNGETTQNGNQVTIAQSGAQAIVLANRAGQTVATPSSLDADGTSFSITRTSAASSAPIPQFDRNPGGWRRQGIGIGRGRWIIQSQNTNPYPSSANQTNPQVIIERRGFRRYYRAFNW